MSWIQYCDCWHKPLCLKPNSGSRRIKLLNCDTLAVEEATDDHPYVALSYVWGESSSAEDFVEHNRSGRRVLLSKSPRVISDAIHATRSLGYRYLWIDKLCIDQNNANEKHQQIQQMDVIYEKAQLTIIAAAGEDESYGLPGVTRKRVPRMEKVMIGSALEIVWTAKDPHYAIRESVWSTRGWTFQEAVLSRRRLVFLDDQVYFECNAMNCWESLITPLDTIHIKSRTRMEESFRAGVFDRNERMRFGDFDLRYLPVSGVFAWYLSSIEEYTARKLRFDTDSCTALSGVMRRFTKRERPIYEIAGRTQISLNGDLTFLRGAGLVGLVEWGMILERLFTPSTLSAALN
ncbi:hypothetical protein E8E14_013978 [Neopestalotiopsis sp. 37M]|nr:hypothetical protein E8E14_013978 [Neopestalotiopsis sp. 37M]